MNDDPAFYRARAEEEQRNADNATLDNVRDRCRRAQLAWEAMADRAARTRAIRLVREADTAARRVEAQDLLADQNMVAAAE